MKKNQTVKSQYHNPDRFIERLKNKIKTSKLFRETQDKRIVDLIDQLSKANGIAAIIWEKGTFKEQNLMGILPNSIHVGEVLAIIGRVVKIEEKLTKKGEPVSLYQYELIKTNVLPSITVESK